MVLGAFDGDLIFETSDERVLTYQGLQRANSSRWQSHEIIGACPRREFLGENTPTLSFLIHLSAVSGVSPDREADRWMQAAQRGRTGYLVIGGRVIGQHRWSVTKAAFVQLKTIADGRTLSADITVTMEGYA